MHFTRGGIEYYMNLNQYIFKNTQTYKCQMLKCRNAKILKHQNIQTDRQFGLNSQKLCWYFSQDVETKLSQFQHYTLAFVSLGVFKERLVQLYDLTLTAIWCW